MELLESQTSFEPGMGQDSEDELYVLSIISGLCAQQPRDEVVLSAALALLCELQQKRESPKLEIEYASHR